MLLLCAPLRDGFLLFWRSWTLSSLSSFLLGHNFTFRLSVCLRFTPLRNGFLVFHQLFSSCTRFRSCLGLLFAKTLNFGLPVFLVSWCGFCPRRPNLGPVCFALSAGPRSYRSVWMCAEFQFYPGTTKQQGAETPV